MLGQLNVFDLYLVTGAIVIDKIPRRGHRSSGNVDNIGYYYYLCINLDAEYFTPC